MSDPLTAIFVLLMGAVVAQAIAGFCEREPSMKKTAAAIGIILAVIWAGAAAIHYGPEWIVLPVIWTGTIVSIAVAVYTVAEAGR